MKLELADLPALHTLASDASQTAQHRYLMVLRGDLVILVLGAIAGAVHSNHRAVAQSINLVAAIVFFAGFGFTIVLLVKNYDRIWYGGRAAAESVKTLAWRYAMRVEPFHNGSAREIDERFVNALRAILSQREALNIVVERVPLEGKQITPAMAALRAADLQTRLRVYLRDRVEEQRDWYARKSGFNAKMERRFFGLVLLSQAVAGVFAVVLVALPEIDLALTAVFATGAAAFLVWMQAKQYQELSQSYVVASQELTLALALGQSIETEAAFSQFVADTESAVSREHTLWIARRDRLPQSTRF